MFDEMKRKLTELLSQGSWSSEDDKQKAISTVCLVLIVWIITDCIIQVSNMKVSIMDSESLSERYEGRDKILEVRSSSVTLNILLLLNLMFDDSAK